MFFLNFALSIANSSNLNQKQEKVKHEKQASTDICDDRHCRRSVAFYAPHAPAHARRH
jgi:hypothetical protein